MGELLDVFSNNMIERIGVLESGSEVLGTKSEVRMRKGDGRAREMERIESEENNAKEKKKESGGGFTRRHNGLAETGSESSKSGRGN